MTETEAVCCSNAPVLNVREVDLITFEPEAGPVSTVQCDWAIAGETPCGVLGFYNWTMYQDADFNDES